MSTDEEMRRTRFFLVAEIANAREMIEWISNPANLASSTTQIEDPGSLRDGLLSDCRKAINTAERMIAALDAKITRKGD